MNSKKGSTRAWLVFIVGAVCLAFTVSMIAQVQTKTSETTHKASVVTKVESGEIVYVEGNNVVVKMADGSLRHFDNVPDSAKVTVDGQQLGVHDLKVGMKVQRTITTTSTPKTITTVKSVTGTVWHVNAPRSVILTLEDGKNQQFKIPKGQMFDVDGKKVSAFGLKKGMRIVATQIVEAPAMDVTSQSMTTGSMPPPPPPPPDVPMLVAEETPVPVEAPAAPAPELPKTGSELPLIGLLGLLSMGSSLGLRAVRKIR